MIYIVITRGCNVYCNMDFRPSPIPSKDRGLDPKTCPVKVVLNFLQSLLDTRRAASSLRVYAAVISAFHDLIGVLSIGKHHMLSQFLKGANRLHPGRCLRAPSWDLPLVLRSLTTAPYKPLGQGDLNFLIRKTVFLLAVCSTKSVYWVHEVETWQCSSFTLAKPVHSPQSAKPSVN